MRIVCLISSVRGGGAERVMSRLVTFLAERHQVTLLTLEAPGVAPSYYVPATVRFIQADLLGGRGLARMWRIASRLRTVRRHVKELRADVVLSFMETMNLTALVASLGLGIAVVVSERTDPAKHRVGVGVALARRLLYPLAARTVVQTSRVARFFPRAMQHRISIIPNPIDRVSERARPDVPNSRGRFRIVSVGSLEFVKGFDRLIRAFAIIADRHELWDLVIFGEGSERDSLARQARELGLSARVCLPGWTREPERALASSHIAAVPSRYEGFPNALGEALAAGLPTVGYEQVSGVEDLIVDGVTGFLVPADAGTAGLAGALERLAEDAQLRKRMGLAAQLHADRWESGQVLAEWEDLLRSAAGSGSAALEVRFDGRR